MRLSVFHKFLLSYSLIFLIPLIIFGVVIYHNVVSNLQHEITTSNLLKLEQVQSLIDQQHTALEHTAARISVDPKLMHYKLKNDGYMRKEAVDALAKYQSNSPLADSVYLYYRGDKDIYSGYGFSSLNTLTSFNYQFAKDNEETFIDHISHASEAVFQPAESVIVNRNESKMLMTYLFPVPIHSADPTGTVVFFIDERKLTDLIWNILGAYEGSMYILNENGDIMASRDNGAGWALSDIERVLRSMGQSNVFTAEVGNNRISAVRTQSDVTGWTFLTMMPTDQFYNRVIEWRTFLIVLVAILLISGLGMAVLFSRRFARRIRMAAEITKEYWGLLNKQRPLVKEQFLSKLIRGDFKDKQEYEPYMESHPSLFKQPCYFVIYIEIQPAHGASLPSNELKLMWQMVSELELTDGCAYAVPLLSGNSFAMIYNVKDHSLTAQRQYAEKLVQMFKQACSYQPAFGVGTIYEDITKINRSYVEASAAIAYKIKLGRGVPIYFREIQDAGERSDWYPLKDQYKLAQSLKQGDEIVALETLSDIFSKMETQEQSFLLLKCMCFDVINTILKIINELKMQEYSDKIKQLVEFHSIEELHERLRRLIAEICEHIKQEQSQNKQSIIERIKGYIEEHYTNDQLNLELVADQFELSPSYLSRLIKEHVGLTFTSYVIHLRMEEVKRQLVVSDKSIKEIIVASGYTDVPSFTRRFKQMEGITPGDYRNSHKKLQLQHELG